MSNPPPRVVCWTSSSGKKPVKEWLAALDEESFIKIDKLLAKLRFAGRFLTLPHSKNLGEGLFELRDCSRGPGWRLYYCWEDGTIVILLAAGDKSSQDRDIKIARKRMDQRNNV